MSLFLTGVTGAAVMAILMALGHAIGLIDLNIPQLLGYLVTGNFSTESLVLGWFLHLLNGGLFAFVYRLIFKNLKVVDWKTGAVVGLCHWFVAGLVMAWLQEGNPILIYSLPGEVPFESALGTAEILWVLALHLIYGILLGMSYASRSQRFTES